MLVVESLDPVLRVLASVGLAAAAGSALIVDFGAEQGSGRRTLADLIEDGPLATELSPGQPGVASINSGSASEPASVETLERLAASWHSVVIRGADPKLLPFAVVPVRALYPGLLSPSAPGAAVWQPTSAFVHPPGPGPVMPRLSRHVVSRILHGRHPGRGRWVNAWGAIWELPWA